MKINSRMALLLLGLAFSTTVFATSSTLMAKVKAASTKEAGVMALSDQDFDAFTDHVEKGEKEWIALVPDLAKRTDAGRSESLTISLATGLPINPNAVLAVLRQDDSPLSVKRVCSGPFIEISLDEARAWVKKSLLSLNKVTDPALRPVRDACSKALNTPIGAPVE